ncbi:MAG TPA: DUF6623 family protein [Pyrinomonadaceae bacterium]|jgi:hypothetical protein
MPVTERWVHGTLVQSEDPVEFVVRRGWGTHYGVRNSFETWFHFPLTTLAAIDGHRQSLRKVFVFYRTDGSIIKSLNIYDGPRRIKVFEQLNLMGDHSGAPDASNTWQLEPPLEIRCGVGISVEVEFLEGVNMMSEILFTAAGAEFII